MFWFDKSNPDALFMDRRSEQHTLTGNRLVSIRPDILADFTAMPFPDERFSLVVFDPPHLNRAGPQSWMAKKYGKLTGDWRQEIRSGFAEAFRVLKPGGTLVFKWNETQIKVSEILSLTKRQPLFGNRCGKASKSHWLVFLK